MITIVHPRGPIKLRIGQWEIFFTSFNFLLKNCFKMEAIMYFYYPLLLFVKLMIILKPKKLYLNNSLSKVLEKSSGSGTKIRVNQRTVNTQYFFFGLTWININ